MSKVDIKFTIFDSSKITSSVAIVRNKMVTLILDTGQSITSANPRDVLFRLKEEFKYLRPQMSTIFTVTSTDNESFPLVFHNEGYITPLSYIKYLGKAVYANMTYIRI